MTSRKERAERGRAWAEQWSTCPNCGEKGRHYAPPGFGSPGTFVCKKPSELEPEPFIACAVDGDGRPTALPPKVAASILDAVKRKFEHDRTQEAPDA